MFNPLDSRLARCAFFFLEDGPPTPQVLEDILQKGQDEYTEITMQCIAVQLPVFRRNYTFSSTAEHGDILTGLSACVRGLSSQAEALLLGRSRLPTERSFRDFGYVEPSCLKGP